MVCATLSVQVGGLGDVVTSLAKAHQSTGTLVEVVMPKYDCSNYRYGRPAGAAQGVPQQCSLYI